MSQSALQFATPTTRATVDLGTHCNTGLKKMCFNDKPRRRQHTNALQIWISTPLRLTGSFRTSEFQRVKSRTSAVNVILARRLSNFKHQIFAQKDKTPLQKAIYLHLLLLVLPLARGLTCSHDVGAHPLYGAFDLPRHTWSLSVSYTHLTLPTNREV